MTFAYQIDDTQQHAETFYKDVARTTDIILSGAKDSFSGSVKRYQSYIINSQLEKPRSFDEYLLEIIMIGILWLRYENEAINTPTSATKLLYKLYLLRKNNPDIKSSIDKLRGRMISSTLYPDNKTGKLEFTYASFQRLVNWLNASGELFEETKRINGWLQYASSLEPNVLHDLLEETYRFAIWFEKVCKSRLGSYTIHVSPFVEQAKSTYKNREDYGLATRKEIEYHMNMIAAEILNRALRDRFMAAKRKIVLLPTCMQIEEGKICRARQEGIERKCTGCNVQCNVGKASNELKKYEVDVYLIPHSSNFSKTLQRWQDVPDVALVGVACVLNLLLGGYEMIGLDIPSQCVYLNYCSCKKHWDEKGVTTSVDIKQLFRILGIEERNKYEYPTERIALVNEDDEILGYGDKIDTHLKGELHRAFSVLIFNPKGEILLQQRALGKYHSPLLWTNTCCSHLVENNSMEAFVHERLQYEMGFDCELKYIKKFHYNVTFEDGMTENEIDYLYAGIYKNDPKPNKEEVSQWEWFKEEILKEDIKNNPDNYTYWFKNIMENHFEEIKSIVFTS